MASLFRRGWCESKARLDGKTVIVTGANTGIGKETCRALLERGARLIMACRNLVKAKEAADEIRTSPSDQILVKHLDLTSLESVRQFSSEVLKEEPKVHILINNAGVMLHPEDTTQDGFEMHIGVNHLGHFLLTLLLLKPLKAAVPSRIINVSSIAHIQGKIDFEDINLKKSFGPKKAYCQSKLANILFSNELARKLDGTGITVYSLHPGVVNTELGRYINESVNKLVGWGFNYFGQYFFKTPEKGAQTTIYCAIDEALENVSGKYYSDCAEKETSSAAKSVEDAQKLWNMSLTMVGLSEDPTSNIK